MDPTALAVVIIVVALGFDFTNGFHDSGNAIATSISTRALTPRVALALAAVMNIVGALISTKVAATVGGGIIEAADRSRRPGHRAGRAARRDRVEPGHLVARPARRRRRTR